MEGSTEKKVLVDVIVLDNFIESKKNITKAKEALNDFLKSGSENAEMQRKLAADLANANNQYKEAKKELESASKSQQIFNQIGGDAVKTLGQMQRELTALKNTPFTGMDSKQIQEVKQMMSDLTDEIEKTKTEIEGVKPEKMSKNMLDGLQAISAGISAVKNTMNVFGIETGASFDEISKKTTQLIAIVQALGTMSEFLEKKKHLLIAANIKNVATSISSATAAKAEALAQKLLGASVVTTSTSFKLLRGAIISTGIGALIVAVGMLIANWENLTKWMTKSTDGMTGFGKALDKIKEVAMGVYEVIKTYVLTPFRVIGKILEKDFKGAVEEIKNGFDVVENYQRGSNEQRVKNQEDASKKMADANTKMNSEKMLSDADALEKQLEIDRASGKSADDLYEQEKKILAKRIEAYKSALSIISDENSDAHKEMSKNIADAEHAAGLLEKQNTKRINDEKKQQAEKAKAEQQKRDKEILDASNELISEKIKSMSDGIQKEIATIRENARKRLEEIKGNSEAEIALRKQIETNANNEVADVQNKFQKEQRGKILSLLDETLDEQIKHINSVYDEAIATLGEIKVPVRTTQSDSEFAAEMAEYEQISGNLQNTMFRLEQERFSKTQKATKDHQQKIAMLLNEEVAERYAEDFLKNADNERGKLETQIKYLNDLIAARKKAGLDTYNEDAELRKTQLQLEQLDLNKRLLLAGGNAKKIFEAKRDALNAEAALYKGNEERQLEIARNIAEVEQEYLNARLAAFQEYSSAAMNIAGATNQLFSQLENNQMAEEEEANNKKKKDLEARLKAGLISQEAYDAQIAKMDADLDKKKAEIARKQAAREKALQVMQIGINTAAAIMKIWAEVPKFDFGVSTIALTAAAAALGAIQLATVIATPLPKAARGRLIKGKSHLQGGEIIEAEAGEAIINKKSVSMFAPLLSAINQAGGGVPFTRPFSDGGYAARGAIATPNSGATSKMIIEAVDRAFSQVKIAVAVEDIRREDTRYAEVQHRATY